MNAKLSASESISTKPLLSIVVTSYTTERLEDIFYLLDSIKAQTYTNTEIIFVIERSLELFDQIGKYVKINEVPNVHVVFSTIELGASFARNFGIKDAKGNIVAFVDDDVILFPDWAEEMVNSYAHDDVIGVTGQSLPLCEDKLMNWLPKEFYWIFGGTGWLNSNEARDVRNVWTMNASFRREVFDAGLLFATKIGPRGGSMQGRKNEISEDVEFSMRVREKTGKRIIYNPKVKVRHKVSKDRMKWTYIVRWSYWIGLSKRKLKIFYKDSYNDVDILCHEHQLLRRIITGLFPAIIRDFFRHPVIAFRKFSTTMIILSFVALGYCTASLRYWWEIRLH